MARWQPGDDIHLTKTMKTNLGFYKGLAASGMNVSQGYATAKDLGIAPRYQNFLQVFSALQYTATNPEYFMPSDTSVPPSTELIPQNPFRQKKRYQVVVEYDYYDDVSGVVESDTFSLSSDSPLSEDQIKSEAVGISMQYEIEGVHTILDQKIKSYTWTPDPIFG